RHAPVDAAVERIADDGGTDGAEMDANLVRASRVDGEARQRERPAEMIGAHYPRDRFATASDLRALRRSPRGAVSPRRPDGRHLLAVHRIAADRRVDPAPRHHLAPDHRDVFLLALAVGG